MIFSKLNFKILLIFNFIFIYLFTPNISFSEDKFLNKINHANILMYHRFGENKYPTTNTKIEQFISHTKELVNEKYDVIRLDKVIEGIKLHSNTSRNVNYKIFGVKDLINPLISKHEISKDRFDLVHTENIVLGEDTALSAAKRGKDTSLWLAKD